MWAWKINIHNMFQQIPEELEDDEDEEYTGNYNEDEDNNGYKMIHDI